MKLNTESQILTIINEAYGSSTIYTGFYERDTEVVLQKDDFHKFPYKS